MLYFGRVKLLMTEKEFWDTTPRRFSALVDAAVEYERGGASAQSNGPEFGYIDQIPGW